MAIRPFAPRSVRVMLRRYTSVTAVLVPNLGLRLIFPPGLAGSLVLAITNPVFRAKVLPGNGGVVITARGGFHHRYCGNVFAALQRFRVSILVCTGRRARRYTSDLIFVGPPKPIPAMPTQRPAPHIWARLAAQWVFGDLAYRPVLKQRTFHFGPERVSLAVERFFFAKGVVVLAVRVRARPAALRLDGLTLSRGAKRRRRARHFSCMRRVGTDLPCVVLAPRPHGSVRRWVVDADTNDGDLEVSW